MQHTSQRANQLGGRPDWWRGCLIYQIYPRSYLDTNHDGVGDLAGIEQKLDYLAWLGVDALWISPFFKSPMKDFGYDVSDYCDVDPLFGSLADFDRIIARAHQLGLRVLIDQVLSHTSDQHEWFKASRSSRDNPKADWYVWADPKPDGTPPNNWLSIFGGSAWEWDTHRCQYYLHNFLSSQPDLNFHNPEVQSTLLDMVRFWLDRGVDGFRLDTANMYVHDAQLRDNPVLESHQRINGIDKNNPYARQNPIYNINRPETLTFMERLRQVLDEYPAVTTVGEIGAVTDMYRVLADYTVADKRLHMAYSFDLMTPEYSAKHLREVFERMNQAIGSGWPCWAVSNHDVKRVVTRWGLKPEYAPFISALVMSARGTACMYQGEELGLPEANVAYEDLQDPYGIRFWPEYAGRDGCRTPMPWQIKQLNAGFSDTKPWLPVSPEHYPLAVGTQVANPYSILHRMQQFIHWRKQYAALREGEMVFWEAPEPVLVFTRSAHGQTLVCAFNLGDKTEQFDTKQPQLHSLTGHGFKGQCEHGRLNLPAKEAFFGILVER